MLVRNLCLVRTTLDLADNPTAESLDENASNGLYEKKREKTKYYLR